MAVYFHGVAHPPTSERSRGINFSRNAVREICRKLRGVPVKEVHWNTTVGRIVHAYIDDDDQSLWVVGRVGDPTDQSFETAAARRMLLDGAAQELSLSHGYRLDMQTAEIEPVGDPIEVSILPPGTAGRGPDCKIAAAIDRDEVVVRTGRKTRQPPKRDETGAGAGGTGPGVVSGAGFGTEKSRDKLAQLALLHDMVDVKQQQQQTPSAPANPAPVAGTPAA
ncbi:MAG: hypothetical protein WC241_04885, partial [Candidatus Paceibacterota bacterium]